MIPPLVYLSIAFFMAILLAQAGVHKLVARRTFQASLRGHGIVPQILENSLTIFLAGFELFLAIAWIIFPQTFWVGLATAFLLLGYAFVLTKSYFTGRIYAGCGCDWGETNAPIQLWMPLRNIIIAIAALSTIAPDYNGAPNLFEIFNALAFSICAAIIYYAISEFSLVRIRAILAKEVDHG